MEIFWVVNNWRRGATGIWWVEAGTMKNGGTANVSSVEAVKPQTRETKMAKREEGTPELLGNGGHW